MNYMEYLQRINSKFERGLIDGQRANYKPGLTYGKIRSAYDAGYREGLKIRSLKKIDDYRSRPTGE